MPTVIYVFLLPICSGILCVFGFFVGRCARKLPIIDNGLPWAISRSQIPPWRESGWISPVKSPEQSHPVSPESHANDRAA